MCGSHTYTFRALGGHFYYVALFEGKIEALVVAISFLDLLEFIANVKFGSDCRIVTPRWPPAQKPPEPAIFP
jgi:hypothetical protein